LSKMKLQLDTTVSFHKCLDRPDDPINRQYEDLREKAESVHASTFTKREFAFSLINDCCALQAHLVTHGSFIEGISWIQKYGYYRKRFAPRMLDMIAFFVLERYGTELIGTDEQSKDRIIAKHLFEYLRLVIPELWDRFEENIRTPLDDRTKCPFARQDPLEKEGIYTIKCKSPRWPCDGSEQCKLKNMVRGERERALILLEQLRSIPDSDPKKTTELETIQETLKTFFEDGDEDICYEKCIKGIGDMVIALETDPRRTLVTTNAKETEIISPAISQKSIILKDKSKR